MKKMIGIVALVLALVTALPGMAECTNTYQGEANFILSNSGRMLGVKSTYEEVETLYQFQCASVRFPVNVEEDGRIVRYKAMSKVELEEEILQGATSLQVKVDILEEQLCLVRQIVAERNGVEIDELELNAGTIINATHYFRQVCEKNTLGAHVFFTSKSEKILVGKVTFCNGSWAYLYAGHFEGSCQWYLGFAAGVVVVNQEEPVAPSNPQSHEEGHGSAKITVTVEEHEEIMRDKTVTIVIEGEFDYEKVLEGIASGTNGNSCQQ